MCVWMILMVFEFAQHNRLHNEISFFHKFDQLPKENSKFPDSFCFES